VANLFAQPTAMFFFCLRDLSKCKVVRDRLAPSEPGQSFCGLVDRYRPVSRVVGRQTLSWDYFLLARLPTAAFDGAPGTSINARRHGEN